MIRVKFTTSILFLLIQILFSNEVSEQSKNDLRYGGSILLAAPKILNENISNVSKVKAEIMKTVVKNAPAMRKLYNDRMNEIGPFKERIDLVLTLNENGNVISYEQKGGIVNDSTFTFQCIQEIKNFTFLNIKEKEIVFEYPFIFRHKEQTK